MPVKGLQLKIIPLTNKETTINQLYLCTRNVVLSKYKAPIFALSLECISFVKYKKLYFLPYPCFLEDNKVSDCYLTPSGQCVSSIMARISYISMIIMLCFVLNKYACLDLHSATSLKEEFEGTKVIIRIRKSMKDRQHNRKMTKGQPTIYKTLHRKLKIERHEPH